MVVPNERSADVKILGIGVLSQIKKSTPEKNSMNLC